MTAGPGLQRERSVMAWERTALSSIVTIGLMIRHLRHVPLWMLVVAYALGVLVVDVARRRARTIDTSRNPIALRSVTAATVLICAISLAVVLTDTS